MKNYFGKIIALVIMMAANDVNSATLYQDTGSGSLRISPILASGISNALARFKETKQDLQNFTIDIEQEEGEILISFNAKFAPGEKGLGGRTSLGVGRTYHISPVDGSIIKEHGQR